MCKRCFYLLLPFMFLILLLLPQSASSIPSRICHIRYPLPISHQYYQPGDLSIAGIISQVFTFSNPVIYNQHPSHNLLDEIGQNTKMSTENFTSETGFILLGLTSQQNQRIVLFVVFLTMYLLTVLGNLLIIILVHIDAQLHTPMYFFLCHLASLDIVYVTSSLPQTLVHLLAGNGVLSLTSCMLQGYSGLLTGSTECLLLGVMAYDRYFAICNPLRYVSAMNRKHQHLLATSCWIIGGVFSMVNIICIFRHSFCGPNHINHFMCELHFLIALACDDIKLTK
ncbi:Olfactory receptor 13C4, partial [Ophiophagus hannah]